MTFLLQEFLREINTIGSKTDNVKTSHLVVSIKTEIEKLISVIAEKLPPIVDETCTGRLAKVFEELAK